LQPVFFSFNLSFLILIIFSLYQCSRYGKDRDTQMIEETICNWSKFLMNQRFEDMWSSLSNEAKKTESKKEFINDWEDVYKSISEGTRPSQFKIICKIQEIIKFNDNHWIVRYKEITKIKLSQSHI